MPSVKNRYQKYREELAQKVDYLALYHKLGVEIIGDRAGPTGWIAAKSHPHFGGPDSNPSAGINIISGLYKDFRTGDIFNVFDFMVAIDHAPNWRDAQKQINELYDIRPPSISKSHPEHGVTWQPWLEESATTFCLMKAPITPEGLLRSGARMCTWYDQPALAWPIWDEQLHIIGYYYIPRNGLEFNRGGKSRAIKFAESYDGLIGTPAVRKLLSDRHPDLQAQYKANPKENLRNLFWCEGVTDMAAAYSLFPNRADFVSNAHGAQEGITMTQVEIVKWSPLQVVFVADHDIPGLTGAYKKKTQLQKLVSSEAQHSPIFSTQVVCVHDPKESPSGNDLRDWLLARQDQLTVDAPADDMAPVTLGGHEFFSSEDPNHQLELQRIAEEEQTRWMTRELTTIQNIMDRLGYKINMVYPDGSFVIGCAETDNTKTIRNFKSLSYADLLTVGGLRTRQLISKTEDLNGQQIATFEQVKEVLALAVSEIGHAGCEIIGEGLWLLQNENNLDEKTLTAVKEGDFYLFQNGILQHRVGPNYHKYIADWEDKTEWFNLDTLNTFLPLAKDVAWRKEVYNRLLKDYLINWNWVYPHMAMTTAGLIYATWLQTIWPWRPIVTLTGESASGKSLLLQMIGNLYLNSAPPLGASTTAGIMQQIRHKAMPLLCDEFDAAKEQLKILKALRATSRSQPSAKGTADQTGRMYQLSHIPWLSGIHYAATEQADLNRLITLQLFKLTPSNHLNHMTEPQAYEMGHQILASTITVATQARELAQGLLRYGEMSRFRESYSVPFAMIGALLDVNIEVANEMLETYIDEYVIPEMKTVSADSDQDDAIMDILQATVRLPLDAPVQNPTLGMMLLQPDEYAMYWDHMEPLGVAVKQARDGKAYFAINTKQIQNPQGLLGRSKWAGTGLALNHILRRFGIGWGAEHRNVRINGTQSWAICIPLDRFRSWMVGESIVLSSNEELF